MRIDYQRGWWNGLQGEVYSTKKDQWMQKSHTPHLLTSNASGYRIWTSIRIFP